MQMAGDLKLNPLRVIPGEAEESRKDRGENFRGRREKFRASREILHVSSIVV